MKRLTSLLLILVLTLTLASCSPSQTKTPFQLALTNQLITSKVFSEPLEPLDADIAWMLYGLENAGISQADVTGLRAYRSSGATCEEVAVFLFADEATAQTAATALDAYLDAQIQSNRDYRPAELPKLEQAVLECRGTTVLIMVANDYEASYKLLTP